MNNHVSNSEGIELIPEAYHPGMFLEEEIEERQLLKKDVAKALGLLPNNLSHIFSGKRPISVNLALKLEKYLGISAEYWYGMQAAYDLQEARKREFAT